MRTNRPSPLPATLGVALAVFGGTAAVLMRSGPLDPRVAMAGLVAAGGLTVALAAMIWARHRTEAALTQDRRGPVAGVDGPGAMVVIPLGQGQAAVIFDDPVAAARPAPDPVTGHREALRTADAIWAAVDAAVAATSPSPAGPNATPPGPGQGNPPGPGDGTR